MEPRGVAHSTRTSAPSGAIASGVAAIDLVAKLMPAYPPRGPRGMQARHAAGGLATDRCRGGQCTLPARARPAMYFDKRLWRLMRGARGRIAACVAIGLAASAI